MAELKDLKPEDKLMANWGGDTRRMEVLANDPDRKYMGVLITWESMLGNPISREEVLTYEKLDRDGWVKIEETI